MGSPSTELPEFFKVYLPDYSRERLHIPTAFIKHFNGLVPEKAILRDTTGRVWHVEVGQIQNEVYFLKGWQKFRTDNSVEEGDFFVFGYDGYHIFDFMLFGRNACEKRDLDKVRKDFCVKEETDVGEAEREEEEEEGNKEEEEVDEEEDEEEEDEEEDEDEDEEEYDEDEEEEEEEEDSTEEEEESSDEEEDELQPESSKKKVIELKHKYSGRGRPRTGGYKQTAVKNAGVEYVGTSHSKSKSKNPSCTTAEVEDSFSMASIYETRNPYFKARLRKWKRSKLYIPIDVLRDYNIALPKKMFFRDPLGRTWPGTVSLWKDGRTWITGWRALCKWNRVGENDTLICELVQEGGCQTDLIVVHIYRAQPKACCNQSCK